MAGRLKGKVAIITGAGPWHGSVNAVAESCFASLEKERVQWMHYQTRDEAQRDSLDSIAMFYNSCRLHATLNYTCPNGYESDMAELMQAA